MNQAYCHAMARQFERWDSEDLAQDLIVLVWKLRRAGEREPAYVYRCMKNFCLNHYKRRRLETYWVDSLEVRPEADAVAMMSALLHVLHAMAQEFPDEQFKKIFQLKGMGYTVREIGQQTSLSKSEVARIMGKMKIMSGG